jgi:Lysine-specific metallo-endopeptidase
MEKFSGAYTKLRKVMTEQTYQEDWEKFFWSTNKAGQLLGEDGLELGGAELLDDLRWRLKQIDAGKRPQAMLDACISAEKVGSVADRAAALKMLKHLYQEMSRGGQDVWVFAPPKAYTTWIFDEIKGSNDKIKGKLAEDNEVYSDGDRSVMVSALDNARKWSSDAVNKLATPDDATKTTVQRWFADENTSDEDLKNAMGKLKDGFKAILNKCNSSRLVFSDDPVDRVKVYNKKTGKVGWDDWAFVNSSEKMHVVYIQGAFLKAGATGKIWKCALTIVHELSHREVKTDDLMYDFKGLKPHKTKFPSSKALKNADSWAYFATDLAGCLAETDRNSALKVAA